MTASLASSYRYCEALTRREAGNFYPAFRNRLRQWRGLGGKEQHEQPEANRVPRHR